MTGANRVGAQVLHQAQPPFEHLIGHGRTETARIVMQTDALDLHRFAVEEEAFVGVEFDRANPEGRRHFLHDVIVRLQNGAERVQIGRFGRPQLWARNLDLRSKRLRRLRSPMCLTR